MFSGGTFAAIVSGAPVTKWEFYDTHYTERYLGDPRTDPQSYAQAQAITAAPKIRDPLMLIHGMADDNVIFGNATRVIDALQAKSTPFEMMLYPTQRHGFDDARLTKHLQQAILDFVLRTVGASAAPDSRTR